MNLFFEFFYTKWKLYAGFEEIFACKNGHCNQCYTFLPSYQNKIKIFGSAVSFDFTYMLWLADCGFELMSYYEGYCHQG